MIPFPANMQIWIVASVTDMRRGFTGLSAMVQNTLQQNPLAGHVFIFRGRRGDFIKLLWHDGDGVSWSRKFGLGFKWRVCSSAA